MTESVLQVCHAFKVSIAENFAIYGVVGNLQLSFVVSIMNINNFDAIRMLGSEQRPDLGTCVFLLEGKGFELLS